MQCALHLAALITLLAVSAPATVDMVANTRSAQRRGRTCPILTQRQLLATLLLELPTIANIRKSFVNILKPDGNSMYHQV